MSDRSRRPLLLVLAVIMANGSSHAADDPLRIEAYVEIVLRSNPTARAGRALEESGAAQQRNAGLWPDPVFEVAVDRAQAANTSAGRKTETGLQISQSVPWLPARSASLDAADRAADARRAEATRMRWNLVGDARITFYRLQETRALVDVARGAEQDARSLLALISRRTEAGEAREVDRVKARVEWLRQQLNLRTAEREAAAAEAAVRTLAVEPLPRPLLVSGELPAPATAGSVPDEAISARSSGAPIS